jgi:hypothetical protein
MVEYTASAAGRDTVTGNPVQERTTDNMLLEVRDSTTGHGITHLFGRDPTEGKKRLNIR